MRFHLPSIYRRRPGQALLIAILMIGGAILGATGLAGYLMVYQVRGATDIVNSGKAIFAADSGANWVLYTYFKSQNIALPGNGALANGAMLVVTCYDPGNNQVSCNNAPNPTTAVAKGNAGGSQRAFFVDVTNSTGTLP